jgi:hypothetical protein
MSLMECPEAVADAVRSLLGDCQRPITTDREEKPQ